MFWSRALTLLIIKYSSYRDPQNSLTEPQNRSKLGRVYNYVNTNNYTFNTSFNTIVHSHICKQVGSQNMQGFLRMLAHEVL